MMFLADVSVDANTQSLGLMWIGIVLAGLAAFFQGRSPKPWGTFGVLAIAVLFLGPLGTMVARADATSVVMGLVVLALYVMGQVTSGMIAGASNVLAFVVAAFGLLTLRVFGNLLSGAWRLLAGLLDGSTTIPNWMWVIPLLIALAYFVTKAVRSRRSSSQEQPAS